MSVAGSSDEAKKLRVYDGELQSDPHTRNSFQPNPLFGSQTNLFGKGDGQAHRQ